VTDYSWYSLNSTGVSHVVGQKKPNNWGIYDLAGNVREFTWVQGATTILCGGGFNDLPEKLSVNEPYQNVNKISQTPSAGFRVIRSSIDEIPIQYYLE